MKLVKQGHRLNAECYHINAIIAMGVFSLVMLVILDKAFYFELAY